MKMFWSALLLALVSLLTSPPAMAETIWSAPVSLSGTFDVHPCTSGSLVVGGCDGGTFELNVQIPKFFGALAPDQVMMLNSISFLGGFTTFGFATNALDVKFMASALVGATFDSVGCSALCSFVTSNSSMGSVSATMPPFGGGILAIPNFVASNGNPTGDSSAWLMIAGHGFVGDSTTIVRMTMDSTFQVGTVSAVPEPGSILLLLAGLALVTWRQRRQS